MESPNLGLKRDIGWNYCEMLTEGKRVHMKCKYCGKVFKGGGISRFKEHLAGRRGGGPACERVPSDLSHLMEQNLDSLYARQNAIQKKHSFVSESNDQNQGLGFESPPKAVTPNQVVLPSSGTRPKKDIAWMYCEMIKTDDRVHIKCNYCSKLFKGGGISRFKEHLAGRRGSAPVCNNVPPDIRSLMQSSLNEVCSRPRKKQKVDNIDSPVAVDVEQLVNHLAENGIDDNRDDDEYCVDVSGALEHNLNISLDEENCAISGKLDSRKRERAKTFAAASDEVGSKIVENRIHLAIGRFLYDIGANLDALDSVYFQRLIDSFSSGVSAPSHHELRGWILKKLVEEIRNDIDQYRKTWAKNGCSVLIEERNTESSRTVLNFLVNCSQGTVFLKSVDSSSLLYSIDALYTFIRHIIEEVGVANVLQVITKNDEHYNVVGKRLMETFPSLFWTPSVFHCIDLILDDFAKLEWINVVIEQARSVTRFVYNHSEVLNLMKRFTFGKDIVQQGLTRASTNFTMLQRLADFKLNLQTMVTSPEWVDSPFSKQLGGLAMLDIISNRSFWSSCILIIRLTSPLLQVLGVSCSKRKAKTAMGYVLAGMYRAKETIKRELVKREDYMFYWNMIDQRWNQQQNPPLLVAGFFLNPKFFYGLDEDAHNKMRSSVFDCIEKLVPDSEVQDKIAKELNYYKDAVGDLGRKMAIRSRDTLLPAEWWAAYGGCCPNLTRLAVRILSQTCSSVGGKVNHIPFEKVYATANCLERKRLSDLVFVQYNIRFREMNDENKNQGSLDPISFDNISIVEDWIMQNELCLADYESSDWMALVLASAPSVPVPEPVEETEDMGIGFTDSEIFDGLKDYKQGC